jgi:hypothetical protein
MPNHQAQSFATFMRSLADRAMQQAADADVTLDYSEESVQRLEDWVAQQEELGLLPEDMEPCAKFWGAYVGEVFVRHAGAAWVQWEDEHGKTAAVQCNDVTTFPLDKVRKRIEQGPENHLASYYHVFKAQMLRGA